jgi:hypothetical protein
MQVLMGTKAGVYHFRYEQPDLIDYTEKLSSGLASLKVDWEFVGGKITGRFILTPKTQINLENFRFCFTHRRLTLQNGSGWFAYAGSRITPM